VNGKNVPWQVTVTDLGSGIDPSSIDLSVDGKSVPIQYAANSQFVHVKLVPQSPGATNLIPISLDTLPDGLRHAKLVVSDWRGNKTVKTWTFHVDHLQPAYTGIAPPPQATGSNPVSPDNNATAAPGDSASTGTGSTAANVAAANAAAATTTTGGTASSGGGTGSTATATPSTAAPVTGTPTQTQTKSGSTGNSSSGSTGGSTGGTKSGGSSGGSSGGTGSTGGGSTGNGGSTGGAGPPPPPPI
jgi:hypothetical protein